jgi:hypothetical protein
MDTRLAWPIGRRYGIPVSAGYSTLMHWNPSSPQLNPAKIGRFGLATRADLPFHIVDAGMIRKFAVIPKFFLHEWAWRPHDPKKEFHEILPLARSKLITGEVVRDYGKIGELTGVGSPGNVSLLLCKRRGQLLLTFRTNSHFEMNWYPVKATAALAASLADAAEDIRQMIATEKLAAIPERGKARDD